MPLDAAKVQVQRPRRQHCPTTAPFSQILVDEARGYAAGPR
jgi:hypothetical protein